MKKYQLIAVCIICTLLSGCSSDLRPNTQRGHQLDEINKHTRNLKRLNAVVHAVNAELLPVRQGQLNDDVSQQSRIGARIEAWGEAR